MPAFFLTMMACLVITLGGREQVRTARLAAGLGKSAILLVIVAMTIWRGYQRFIWRKELGRQVSWLYLLCGIGMLLVMGLHGSLGAWLASDFGVHITADQLLAAGADLNEVLP